MIDILVPTKPASLLHGLGSSPRRGRDWAPISARPPLPASTSASTSALARPSTFSSSSASPRAIGDPASRQPHPPRSFLTPPHLLDHNTITQKQAAPSTSIPVHASASLPPEPIFLHESHPSMLAPQHAPTQVVGGSARHPPPQQQQQQQQHYQQQTLPSHGSTAAHDASSELTKAKAAHHDAAPPPDRASSVFTDTNGLQPAQEVDQIVPYLQIPRSINNSRGSLSEFATQITCLFWFESSMTLVRVEDAEIVPEPAAPLASEAHPKIGFIKWVTTLLSTTQVSQNVILLALMFIYRLKTLNPLVKGKPGSEYRLLTVALMLGNKFLDDNTYTNKTWAEVSGISVTEIHVMEVEFLSNMRYNLFVSDYEWNIWHRKLARFGEYFQRASRAVVDPPRVSPPSGHLLPTQAPPILSPPNSQIPSPHASAVTVHPQYLPSSSQNPVTVAPYLPPALASPAPRMPDVDLRPGHRKRSRDDVLDEPSAKRRPSHAVTSTPAGVLPPAAMQPRPASLLGQTPPRLPMPNVPMAAVRPNAPMGTAPQAYLPAPAVPRAMSAVYGNAGGDAAAAINLTMPLPGGAPPLGIKIPPMVEQYLPRHANLTPGVNGSNLHISPTPSSSTPSAMHASSQELLSPAGAAFQQRSSPYRPVRSVNTLLVPPPSASLHNPPQHLNHGHIHYHPIGKPQERRTGPMPYMPNETSRPAWLPVPPPPPPSGSGGSGW